MTDIGLGQFIEDSAHYPRCMFRWFDPSCFIPDLFEVSSVIVQLFPLVFWVTKLSLLFSFITAFSPSALVRVYVVDPSGSTLYPRDTTSFPASSLKIISPAVSFNSVVLSKNRPLSSLFLLLRWTLTFGSGPRVYSGKVTCVPSIMRLQSPKLLFSFRPLAISINSSFPETIIPEKAYRSWNHQRRTMVYSVLLGHCTCTYCSKCYQCKNKFCILCH